MSIPTFLRAEKINEQVREQLIFTEEDLSDAKLWSINISVSVQ